MAAVDLEYNKGFQIYNSDGTLFHDLVLHKCTYETVVMSLGDKISGILYYKDNALDVKMTEYIIYKGVKYTLVNPPTILKEGLVSDNGELKGMTKYSFTFYHPMYVLNNFSFNDVAVSSDQNKYLSQNKTFSWIGNLNDYVAKINKNLQGTEWFVKVGDNVTQEEKTKLSDVLSFDKNTIAEALKRGYETWEVPYVVDSIQKGEYFYINDKNQKIDYYDEDKRFVVQYGLPTTEITVKDDNDFETPYVFKMGQGVGLKNNSRNPKNNKIITRIAGYGSEDNIPYGYPQIRYYGGTVQYPLYYGIVGGQRVQLIKHPFTRNHLMPSVYGQAVYNKVNPKLSDGSNNPNYNPNIELVDYYDADSTYTNPIKSGSPSYEIHEFGDIKPELGEETIINAVPVNAQETQGDYRLTEDFLQEILDRISATEIEDEKVCLKTLYDKVDAGLSYYAQKGEEGGREYWYRISVTSDEYYQYVSYESGNYNFTATVLKNDSSAPTPEWDDTMDDDGKYLQSYFKITLPILSFDLYACAAITQEMKINMRSGACIGCTFPVQVDWDDYKRNFYNSDGEFDPNGEQRDYTKYPDSSSGQITVMVKKELETFGTLMPNQYQQPTTGDKFVILGISLPESYITNAEQRLDTDMKQYMRDNNVYYYEYPLKFDEHFLISNESILSQMKPNVVVRFDYAGETHALYIKQMSVKYNESPLPKYDITLTDDIEIVLNQIGQVTDEVSKLRLGLGENGIGGNGQEYLRKDIDDTARGTIRMIKGMQVGERFVTGLLGEGGVFRKDVDGTTYLETDKLYVRMKAYFDTVEVKHYLHTGGNRIASQASGIVCSRVEYIDNNGDVTTDLGEAVLFRCYFKANDGDKTIRNDFVIGDLAFCRETNVDVSDVNMHGYWRLVVGRNGNGSLTENKEAWIDLSNRADDSVVVDGKEYLCAGYQNGSDVPIAQDDIIQLGNIAKKDRQGAIVEYVGGEDAPSYQIFQGIGEDLPYPYTLEDKNYVGLGYSSQTGHAYMNVYGDVFIGAKPNDSGESPTYIKYVQEDSETGEPKLSIKAEVEFIHSDGQGGSTSTTMDDFVKSIEDSFKDIQDQIDGEIDTWYYEGVPTLLNLPASEWNTDELKREHIGDLYYDKENGDAYRFIFDTSVEPNEYKWIQIHDDALAEALRLAADAKDTADNKRRVFLSQPTPPYDEGDLWVNATYPANSDSTDAEHNKYYNDVLCAKKAVPRTEDGQEITTFSINDWVLASKYTDDTKFDGYINQILNGTGASGDSAIVANAIRAIKGALNEATIIDGGLVLTSLINLRSNNKTWAGISGQYDATAKGYGIASWYGGGMADWEVYKETHPSATIDDTYAKSLFRFDGSGYLAGGNITWDDQGRVAIKDITTLVGGNKTDILNALTTFNSAFHFNTQQGETTVLSIVPQAGFTSLNITENGTLKPVATQEWVGQNYISVAFFDRLFRAYNGDTLVNANDTKSTIDNIKAMFGFWTEKYISALGKGDDDGGSVISGYLSQLLDVNITSPQVGQALVYNGAKWVNQTIQTGGIDFNDMKLLTVKAGTNTTVIEYKGETAKTLTFDAVANSGITVSGDAGGTITIGYTLPTASANTLGGVKVGNTLSISDGVLNLPTISNLVTGTYRSVTVDTYGRVTAGTNPTTLAGYGITDAKIANGVITLGNDTITPLTDAKIKSDYEWWGQKLDASGKVNGDVSIRMSSFDLSKTDNGVETTIWPGFRVRDNGNRNSFQAINAVSENGTNAGRISVYNYNTSGISVADKGMTISVSKNGDCSISLDGSTTIGGNLTLAATSGTYIKIGNLYLVYDQNNNAIKVSASATGNTTANFYATGAVSALGISDSGGASTFDESQMWQALGTNITTKKIKQSYLDLTGYVQTSALSAYMKGVKVNGTTYTTKDANGIVDLGEIKADSSDFVTLSTAQTITGAKTFSGSIATNGGITPLGVGTVNTASGGNKVYFKRVDKTEAPNNGVVIEYGGSGTWTGQLYLSDNGRDGLYWSGWYNGTREPWRKFAFTDEIVSNIGEKAITNAMLANNSVTVNGSSVSLGGSVTTNVWGNGRTLTIGSKAQSVDGSKDVTWTLDDMNAANRTLSNLSSISDHTANNTEYYPVWYNGTSQLFTSKADLHYNPANKRLTVGSALAVGNSYLTGSQLRIGASTTAYHLAMGSGGSYVWFDARDASDTMVNAFQLYPEYTNFNKSIKALYYRTSHDANSNAGSVGWLKVAEISVVSSFANQPLKFRVTQRGRLGGEITLCFNNSSSTGTNVSEFSYTGNITAAKIVKDGTTFSMYIQKSEGYDEMGITLVDKAAFSEGRLSVTWKNEFLSDAPDGTVVTEATCRYYLSNNVYFTYDSANGGVHLVGGGLYADTYISALGKGDDGGTSTFDETAMWNALKTAGASHKIHNDHLSLGTLTINGEAWNPATSGNKTITITSADGYITPIASGNVNTAKRDGNVWFKKAYVSSDSTPNNGVVIEYGNSTSWVGQLYLGDNANQGLYWNGWYDGVRGTWKKIAFADDYLPLAGGTLTGNLYVGNTTIYASGSNGGLNSMLIGDDAYIGDCNHGGHLGIKSANGTTAGFYFYGKDNAQSSPIGYFTADNNVAKWNGNTMWHAGNDGVNSGLDADLLDGQHGSYYGKASDVTTLQGYFTNGVANSAAKLNTRTTPYKAWGQTYWSNGVPKTISGDMTDVGTISASGDIGVTKSSGGTNVFVSNNNGKIALQTDTNRGLWDYTSSRWLIATNGTNSWLNAGNVGIGTTNPTAKLEVNGSVKIGGATLTWDSTNQALKIDKGFYSDSFVSALGANASGGSSSGGETTTGATSRSGTKLFIVGAQTQGEAVQTYTNPSCYIYGTSLYSNGVQVLTSHQSLASCLKNNANGYINGSLAVGQSTANTTYKLYVKGTSYFNGNVGIAGYNSNYKLYIGGGGTSKSIYAEGDIYTHGSEVDYSDVRLKNIVSYINDIDINMVAKAPIFRYTWKDRINDRLRAGTSAQYWQNVLPQAVEPINDGFLGMSYATTALIASVVTARKVVDHELRVKQLEERIAELENEIKELKAA